MRPGFVATMLVIASACGGRGPIPPTAPLPLPAPLATWKLSGTVMDRNGPVSGAVLSLFLYKYHEDYSAGARSDSQGRFEMLITRTPGDGELRVIQGGYASYAQKFTCGPTASDPESVLCGYQAPLVMNPLLAKVIGMTLLGPSIVSVGGSAPIHREVRLDDGRVLSDDGSSPEIPNSGVSAYDPAIAKVQTGPDTKSHVFGLAVGTATLTTSSGAIRVQIPVQVIAKQ